MTNALLLDTHIILWLDSGDARLKARTREAIDEHWRSGGSILVSAVSAWEIALLSDTGRISLDCPPDIWIERFQNRAGISSVPLTWGAAACAYRLPNLDRRDPADRMLMATAIELGCPLVTYDAPLTDYAGGYGRQTGLRVVG